ncbi:MAG TPA: hypothetical protein VE818_11155 [Nitrososphaeraceae archaeon]|nr:hypothetical protein [Nitrososphaeraceae archaeon]
MDIAVLIILSGCPGKTGLKKPLYDYQRIIFDVLVTQNGNANASNKHLWKESN